MGFCAQKDTNPIFFTKLRIGNHLGRVLGFKGGQITHGRDNWTLWTDCIAELPAAAYFRPNCLTSHSGEYLQTWGLLMVHSDWSRDPVLASDWLMAVVVDDHSISTAMLWR